MFASEEETKIFSIIDLVQIRPWLYNEKCSLFNCKQTYQASFDRIASDLSKNLENTMIKGTKIILFNNILLYDVSYLLLDQTQIVLHFCSFFCLLIKKSKNYSLNLCPIGLFQEKK